MWKSLESLDYSEKTKDKPKIPFEELVRNSLIDWKIDSSEASSILERFNKEKDNIIQNSKQALSDLKLNLNIAQWDIDGLIDKLTWIQNSDKINDSIGKLLDLFEKKQFNSFSEINEEIKRQYWWKSFYEIMNTDDILSNAWVTPEEFEKNYRNYISIISTGISAWSFAIYSAFAEEANFDYKDGKYQIQRFWWMNIPHRIALNNFNNMYANVKFDSEWNITWWIAKVKLDFWEEQWKMDLEINFDNNTITPEIVLPIYSKTEKIDIDQIRDFIHLYTKKQPWYDKPLFIKNGDKFEISQWINPDALNILNTSSDITTLVHEWHHALYSADPKYRELIHDRVRNSNDQQKRAALLAASIKYDIFDPDMMEINKWIVIDEMFNAYYNDGWYDYKTMFSKISSFSLWELSKRYSLSFDNILDNYLKIDDLPILEQEKKQLKSKNEELNNWWDEKKFIQEEKDNILNNIWDMNIALNFIEKKYPDFYQKIENSKKILLDWV